MLIIFIIIQWTSYAIRMMVIGGEAARSAADSLPETRVILIPPL